MTVLAGERVSEIPPRKLSDVGSWMCARHSELRELLERLGMWNTELDSPDMYQLRALLVASDHQAYDRHSVHRVVRPSQLRNMSELDMMSPGEQGRVRLLATLAERPAFGDGGRAVEFSISDLVMFDASGKELILDYLRAVRVAVCG